MVTIRVDTFALKVAFIASFGYALSVVGTTYLDAQLLRHLKYGARSYEFGYWSALLSLPLFAATYYSMSKVSVRWAKCIYSFLWLLLTSILAMWFVFKPEFPHAGILQWTILYSLVIITSTWIRYEDVAYVELSKTPLEARIEMIKSNLTTWRLITLAIFGGYLAAIAPLTSSLVERTAVITDDPAEQQFLSAAFAIGLSVLSVFVLIGPIRESFCKVQLIIRQFSMIEKTPDA